MQVTDEMRTQLNEIEAKNNATRAALESAVNALNLALNACGAAIDQLQIKMTPFPVNPSQ